MSYRQIFASPIAPWQRLVWAVMVLVPPFTSVWPFLGLLNPLWSTFFGFPLHIMMWFNPHPVYGPHSWYELLFVLIWPLAAIVGLAFASHWVLEKRGAMRMTIACVWIASPFYLVPLDSIGPYVDWPLFAVD